MKKYITLLIPALTLILSGCQRKCINALGEEVYCTTMISDIHVIDAHDGGHSSSEEGGEPEGENHSGEGDSEQDPEGTSEEDNNQNPPSGGGETEQDPPLEEDEDEDIIVENISLNKTELILQLSKWEYLYVNFNPEEVTEEAKEGVWSSSDESVATVSEYGKVTAIKEGKAVISFTTNIGKHKGNCVVYVVKNQASIKKEYQRVNDVDSIKQDDIIVFACPEKGLTSSLERKDGYLLPVTSTFSSDKSKITSLGDNTGEYLVSDALSKEGLPSFTLENQNNEFLCGKYLKNILHISSEKGPITWQFEHISSSEQPGVSEGDYIYSMDCSDNCWLMFNTKASRFTLYDSSVQVDMFLPTIYRLTVVLN